MFAGLGGEVDDDLGASPEEIQRLRYPRWEAEYRLKLIDELAEHELVLLFATPPAHKGEGLPGSEALTELAATYRARLVVTAGARRETIIGRTLVVAPGSVAVRFLPADDPRIVATVRAIGEELSIDGLVLRYRTGETDDGLVGEDGAFLRCSFWLVSAPVEIGDAAESRALCEKVLCYASPLGLYAEEIDPGPGRHLGNFPQAFTHLSLIDAVVHVIAADEQLPHGGRLDVRREPPTGAESAAP